MTDEDLSQWVGLMKRADRYNVVDWNLPRARRAFRGMLHSRASLNLVVDYEGRIVAYFSVVLREPPFDDVAYTNGVAVLPGFRGLGITNALMDVMESYLSSRGIRCVMTTSVPETNKPPQQILRRRGYLMAGRRPGAFQIGRSAVPLLIFYKKLNP